MGAGVASAASVTEIESLLEDVEMAARIPHDRGGMRIGAKDRETLAAIRAKFNDRVLRGSIRPLSEDQVAKLRRYWDLI